MEKFLLILREDSIGAVRTPDERLAAIPPMLDWIRSLSNSGNYCSGAPLDMHGQCVSRERVIRDCSFHETQRILRYDFILAENINQAVSIAQTCPYVMKGIAVREVRSLVPLTLLK